MDTSNLSNISIKLAVTATSIALSSYLLKLLWNTKKKLNNDNQEKFPEEWNDLLKYCYLEDYDSIFKLINEDKLSKSILEFKDNSNWTALHVSVSKGNLAVVDLLLQTDIDVNSQNNKGYTALHIAACNGFLEIVKTLLLREHINLHATSTTLETALYLATSNQYIDIIREILNHIDKHTTTTTSTADDAEQQAKESKKRLINQFNIQGSTPLHMAVLRKNFELMKLLLENGADIDSKKKDGSTPLHIAAVVDFVEGIDLLLHSKANTTIVNRFGNTPLHDACIKSNANAVRAILAYDRELAKFIDNDESTPLHLACNLVTSTVESHREVIEALLYSGADINALDAGGATPLHIICCNGDKGNALISLLLENGANPTIENQRGWTPLHHAANFKNVEALQQLRDWCSKHYPEFIETFDENKPKNSIPDVKTTEKSGIKSETGEDRLKRIAHDIEIGKIKNIVFLTGAGISVASGIPAYRTKDGMYDRTKQFQFSLDMILNDPDTFYEGVKDYFYPVVSGKITPSEAHKFIARFNEKGLLLRNFTQNVDMLDERAGIPEDRIVHAHGSFLHWSCTQCLKKAQNVDQIWNEIGRGGIPICMNRPCRGIIRPDVVFFGEGLPASFHQRAISDLRDADLLIIMGSSLLVYPFAGLVNDVESHVPRILINDQVVGPFRTALDLQPTETSQSENQQQNNETLENNNSNNSLRIESRGSRDTIIVGKCDDGVKYLSNLFNI